MKLKIFKTNPHLLNITPPEIMTKDITTLNGIVKGEPTYSKGVKESSYYYLDKEQTDLAVKKTFIDEYDANGYLIGLNMKIEWYDEMNKPALEKLVYIPLQASEASEMIKSRRRRQISYLQEVGDRLGVRQYIDILFNHYSFVLVGELTKNYINNYIENGSKEFEEALKNEKDPQILGILNNKLPDGDTVLNSILRQIT